LLFRLVVVEGMNWLYTEEQNQYISCPLACYGDNRDKFSPVVYSHIHCPRVLPATELARPKGIQVRRWLTCEGVGRNHEFNM
jgi:hypothetical protein